MSFVYRGLTFDEGGNQIDAFGHQIGGPTARDLGWQPPAPAPAPPPPPPPPPPIITPRVTPPPAAPPPIVVLPPAPGTHPFIPTPIVVPPAIIIGPDPTVDPDTLGNVTTHTAPPQDVHIPVTIDTSSGAPRVSPTVLPIGDIPLLGDPYVAIVLIAFEGLASLFSGGASDTIDVDKKLNAFWANVLSLLAPVIQHMFASDRVDGGTTSLIGSIVGVIGGLINAIASIFSKLHDTLSNWFDPLLKLLAKVRDALKRIYTQWLAPILHTIDAIRQVLAILELFHVKFAAALDQALASLEAKITKPYLWALLELNKVTNIIDRIVTVDGLFQRITLLRSTWVHLGAMYAQTWHAQTKNINPFQTKFLGEENYPLVDPNDLADQIAAGLRGEGGALDARATELVSLFRDETGFAAFFGTEN